MLKPSSTPPLHVTPRYLELHFNENGRILSAKLLAFSLDKSRLIRLSQEERTYHIFYQLLAGAKPEEQDALGLEDPSDYAPACELGMLSITRWVHSATTMPQWKSFELL